MASPLPALMTRYCPWGCREPASGRQIPQIKLESRKFLQTEPMVDLQGAEVS